MKALNLDQANQLNTEIQRVQSQTSASQLRSLFAAQHQPRRTALTLFVVPMANGSNALSVAGPAWHTRIDSLRKLLSTSS
jgi:hypothetical protein